MSTSEATPAHSQSIIQSANLTLLIFDPSDESHNEFLVRLWNTPLFISSSGKTSIDTPEKAKAFIERRWVGSYIINGYGTYIVATNTPSGPKFIGTVGLTKGDLAGSYSVPDLGYSILPEENRKGYATEAARLLLKYVKQELGVMDIFGFCDPKNEPSRKVLGKAGLEFRGVKKLGAFGGVEGAVYAMPHMDTDLSVYGLKE